MNDINFDELDAAVNSALKGQASDTNTTDGGPMSSSDNPRTDTPVDRTIIKSQRRGQFMDMVHPSSDMRRSGDASMLPSSRRQSAPLTPLRREVVETETDSPGGVNLSVPTVPLAVTETPPAEEAVEDSPTLVPQPDIEPATQAMSTEPTESVIQEEARVEDGQLVETTESVKPDEPGESSHDSPAEPGISPINDTLDQAETDNEAPHAELEPTNPFIEGASIEKRPLGAFAENGIESDVDVEKSENSVEPEEVKSFGSYDPIDYGQDLAQAAVEDEPVAAAENQEEPVAPEDESSNNPEPAAVGVGALSHSIPQQYRQQSADDEEDEPAGNVFSAEQYEAPLPAQKPKSRTALVVILLLFMVLLGVGAAYAIFVLKLL